MAPGKNLEFAVVEDILADGAYDEALKDVTYVIHCASPLAGQSDNYERDHIQPAIKGTVGILSSAKKIPSVKRVVITSSIAGNVPWNEVNGEESDRVYHAEDVISPNPTGPYVNHFQAYSASKALALNATIEFVEKEKPSFDIINVMPAFIIGQNELVTDPKDILSGTNGLAFGQVLGNKSDSPTIGTSVYLNDVANVHVLALDPKIKGNQNFAASQATVWGDAIDIVKKRFPAAVKDGRLPADGSALTKKINYDASRTEDVLGLKFQDYETQVASVAEHYLELLEKASGK